MTTQRMIELLKIEYACMLRKSHDECDSQCQVCDLVQDDSELGNMYKETITLLETMPQTRQGEWIGISYDGYADGFPVYDEYECSVCGFERKGEDPPDYCECCGAYMAKEHDYKEVD